MNCLQCNCEIPPDRKQAIELLKLKQVCLLCATTFPRVSGIFTGYAGASDMILTDKLGHEDGIPKEKEIEYSYNQEADEIGFLEEDKTD